MIKTILVDLDDTLWATQQNNKEALRELYHHYGWERAYPSFDQLFAVYAPYNEWLWQEYRHNRISKQQLTRERFQHFLEPLGQKSDEEIMEMNAFFLERSAVKSGVIEGAHALLRELKELYKIVVVSNGFKEVQQRKINSAQLGEFIDYIILSEDIGISKPHKGIFDYALSSSHTRRSEAIFLGDSWDADILGCQNSGITAIWLNPAQTPPPTPLSSLRYPVYEVERLDEVPHLIRKLQMKVWK